MDSGSVLLELERSHCVFFETITGLWLPSLGRTVFTFARWLGYVALWSGSSGASRLSHAVIAGNLLSLLVPTHCFGWFPAGISSRSGVASASGPVDRKDDCV